MPRAVNMPIEHLRCLNDDQATRDGLVMALRTFLAIYHRYPRGCALRLRIEREWMPDNLLALATMYSTGAPCTFPSEHGIASLQFEQADAQALLACLGETP